MTVMPVNKVVYDGNTLIDLTEDTVTAASMVTGSTAHAADGSLLNGTLVINKYYTGSSDPPASLGSDGDLYLKVST